MRKELFLTMLLLTFFISGNVIAQDDKKDVTTKNAEEAAKADNVKRRYYSEKEFQDEVMKEVSMQVDRIKKNSVAVLVKEVLEKERSLKMAESQLEKKKEMIENNAKDLQEKIKTFEERQKKILGCIDDNEKDAKNRISQMVDIISSMRPAKAAEMLSVQDSDIAVQVLSGMPPDKVSKVFNLMDREISARLQKQYLNMQK